MLAGQPSPAEPLSTWELDFVYAQSPGFWHTVEELKKEQHTLAEINAILDSHFNQPEEGFATVRLGYMTEMNDNLHSVFSNGYVAARADLLAGGLAKNRVFPEIKGYQTSTIQAEFGLVEPATPRSPWQYQLGSVVGLGEQQSLDALALDLYPKAPIEKSTLFYWGADLGLGYHGYFNSSMRSQTVASLRPTLFHADSSETSNEYEIQKNQVYWRWRTESEWAVNLLRDRDAAFELSALVYGGQQPVPVSILPRAWDAVHHLKIDPSLGQLFGLGSAATLRSDDFRYSARLAAGFFGGYPGVVAQARLSWFEAGVGSLGYEQTSGYRVTESRIKFAQAGIHYEF